MLRTQIDDYHVQKVCCIMFIKEQINGGVNIDFNGTPINRNYQTEFLGVLKDIRAKILTLIFFCKFYH